MSKRIELREYESQLTVLSAESCRYLLKHYSKYLEVHWTGLAGTYVLTAKHYVGVIAAPEIEIYLLPKCPTRNLLYMLSYAYDIAELRAEETSYLPADDLSTLLMEVFLRYVEDLLRRGVRRDYRQERADLRFVRGKLRLGDALRRMGSVDLTLPCEFEEFTEDVRDNHLIRFTLDFISAGRIGTLRQVLRARRCRAILANVQAIRYLPAEIERFEYDRLNEHYRPIHQLCRLILEAAGYEHAEGPRRGGAFLVDMDRLFEAFVAAYLAEWMPRDVTLLSQHSWELDSGRQVTLRPDICLAIREREVLVADAKYKLAPGGAFSNNDVYQVLAYCRALGVEMGYLIYPSWEGPPRRLRVVDGANTIVLGGVQLGSSAGELDEGLQMLGRRMVTAARQTAKAHALAEPLSPAIVRGGSGAAS